MLSIRSRYSPALLRNSPRFHLLLAQALSSNGTPILHLWRITEYSDLKRIGEFLRFPASRRASKRKLELLEAITIRARSYTQFGQSQESLYLLQQIHSIHTCTYPKSAKFYRYDDWGYELVEQLIQLYMKNEDFVAAEHVLLDIVTGTDARGRGKFLEFQSRSTHQLAELCALFKRRIMGMKWENISKSWHLDLDIAVSRSILDFAARIDVDRFSECVWNTCVYQQQGQDHGDDVLHAAVEHNACQLAQRALDRGVNIDAKRLPWDETALHGAIGLRHLEMVELLITKGADIEARNWNEDTPLFLAIKSESTILVMYLLSQGAKIEARNLRKETTLHVAALWGSARVVELLLFHGAEIDAGDHQGRTALHKAVNRGSLSIVKVLTSRGANIRVEDHDSKTAFAYANEKGCKEIVRSICWKKEHTQYSA
ncbi:MAG: hypothetical protein Q9210_003850 [Variospora velana]